MLKRIIALILSFGLMLSFVSFAEETAVNPYKNEVAFIESIGLLPDGFSADAPMSRSAFAKMITDMLYYEVDVSEVHETSFTDLQYGSDFYNAVAMLESLNIVKGNGTSSFKPDNQIAFQDALVMLIKAMGYLPYAEAQGGYPTGYLYTGKQIGITKGIGNAGGLVDMKTAVKLIYNTLFVSSVVLDNVSKDGIQLQIDYTSNFLSAHLDIVKYRAKLVNDGMISFDNTGIIENQIIIEDVKTKEYIKVNTNGVSVGDIFGCEVDAFVKYNEEKGTAELVHIDATPNVVTKVVNTNDIVNVDNSLSFVEYEEDEELGIFTKINISAENPAFFRNGIRLTQATASDLKPEFGNVKFIDNNSDNRYDVVMITDISSNIIVNSVSSDGSKIVCKDNPINTLDISEDSDSAYRIYKDGKIAALSDIAADNIVSVAPAGQLKENIQMYFIYVSDDVTEATLDYTDEGSLSLAAGGQEYELSKFYYDTHNEVFKILTGGSTYTLRFDYFGQVAYIDGITAESVDFAYLLDVKRNGEFDDIKISLYSEYAAISSLSVSKNLVIDGKNVGNSDINKIIELLCTRKDGSFELPKPYVQEEYGQSKTAIFPRLAIVKVNTSGEIYYIDTDTRTYEDDELEYGDPYVLTSGERYLRDTRLKTASNIVYGSPDGTFLVNDKTIVIQVPDIDRYNIGGSTKDINLFELPLSDLNSYRIIRPSDMNSYEYHDMQPYNIDSESGIADVLLLRGYHNYSSTTQENNVFRDFCIFKKLTKYSTGKDDDSDYYKLYYMNQLGEDLSVLVDKNGIHTHFKNIIFGGEYFDSASNPVYVEPLEPGDVFYLTQVNGELSSVGRMLNFTDINETNVSGTRTYSRNYLYQNKYGSSVKYGVPYDVEGSTAFGDISTTFSIEFGIPLRISGTIVKVFQPYKTGTKQPGNIKADLYPRVSALEGRTIFEPFDLAESKILVVEENKCKDAGSSKCEISVRPGSLEDIKFVESYASDGYKKCSKLFYYRNAGYAYNLVIFNVNEAHDM